MAVRSKTTIFNAALLRTGNEITVTGFVARALEANYDEIVRDAFEGQKFPFGKVRIELTSRSDGRFGYDDAYAMPSDTIHVSEVYVKEHRASDLGESWEIDAETNELMIDAKGRKIEIEYIKVGLEHRWSAKFTLGIQRRLEAVIKDVLEEPEEASVLETEGDAKILQAGVKASTNRSGARVRRGGRLIRAHRF